LLPAEVLNRRKVGFDTPAERWMRGSQQDFVRDLVLSSRARARGLWNVNAVERFLDSSSPIWFQVMWKVLSIEAWASVFLDRGESTLVAEDLRPPYALARS
jgi:asparagine synthase (glutamine-hydrolysing)